MHRLEKKDMDFFAPPPPPPKLRFIYQKKKKKKSHLLSVFVFVFVVDLKKKCLVGWLVWQGRLLLNSAVLRSRAGSLRSQVPFPTIPFHAFGLPYCPCLACPKSDTASISTCHNGMAYLSRNRGGWSSSGLR